MIKIPAIAYLIIDDEDFDLVKDKKWAIYNTGYPRATTGEFLHHLILGKPENGVVDHINNDKLDNRRANLRLVSQSQNMSNVKAGHVDSTSQYKGVCWNKQSHRWQANIKRKDHDLYLGNSASEKVAATMYDMAAIMLDGRFAATNILDPFEDHDPAVYLKPFAVKKLVSITRPSS